MNLETPIDWDGKKFPTNWIEERISNEIWSEFNDEADYEETELTKTQIMHLLSINSTATIHNHIDGLDLLASRQFFVSYLTTADKKPTQSYLASHIAELIAQCDVFDTKLIDSIVESFNNENTVKITFFLSATIYEDKQISNNEKIFIESIVNTILEQGRDLSIWEKTRWYAFLYWVASIKNIFSEEFLSSIDNFNKSNSKNPS